MENKIEYLEKRIKQLEEIIIDSDKIINKSKCFIHNSLKYKNYIDKEESEELLKILENE